MVSNWGLYSVGLIELYIKNSKYKTVSWKCLLLYSNSAPTNVAGIEYLHAVLNASCSQFNFAVTFSSRGFLILVTLCSSSFSKWCFIKKIKKKKINLDAWHMYNILGAPTKGQEGGMNYSYCLANLFWT